MSSPVPVSAGHLYPLFFVVAIDAMGMGIVLPLLPFWAERFGASPSLIGILLATFSLCQFLSGPLLGRLSDRYDRKNIMMLCQAGTFLSFVLLVFSNSLFLVFLARIIDGISTGNMSVAGAYAVDRSTPQTRKQAIGMVSADVGLGLIMELALNAMLGQISLSAPLWAAIALSFLSILVCKLSLENDEKILYDNKPVNSSWKSIINAPVLSIFSLMTGFYLSLGLIMSGLALFLAARFTWHGEAFCAAQVGWAFTLTGVICIIVQLVLMKHINRWMTDKKLALLSFGLMAAGYIGMGMTHSLFWLGLSLMTASLGSALLRPTLTSALTFAVPRHLQGMTMGLNQSLMAAANVIAPLVTGLILELGGYQQWAWLVVGLLLLTMLGAMLCIKAQFWPTLSTLNSDLNPLQ